MPEVIAPLLSLSCCSCRSLPQAFPGWKPWLFPPIPEARVTLSLSLCLASCFSSLLHLVNSSSGVRSLGQPWCPTYKCGDSEEAPSPLWTPLPSSMSWGQHGEMRSPPSTCTTVSMHKCQLSGPTSVASPQMLPSQGVPCSLHRDQVSVGSHSPVPMACIACIVTICHLICIPHIANSCVLVFTSVVSGMGTGIQQVLKDWSMNE